MRLIFSSSFLLLFILLAIENYAEPQNPSDDEDLPPIVQKCPANEQWNYCGTACPLTCENYVNAPLPCTKQCVAGCECLPNLVRDANGRCIRKDECPAIKKCPPNERWNNCGTACPLTCKNYLDPPKGCTRNCVIGCECLPGYVRDVDKRCVLPEMCSVPPDCPQNSTYSDYPTHCNTCEKPFADTCPKVKKGDCYCDEGYVKHKESGQCLLVKDCPNICPKNQVWSECATACPLTCENYLNPPKFCIKLCRIGCECAPNYIKDIDGSCVLREQCSVPPKCPPNSTFSKYPTNCKTCGNPYCNSCPDVIQYGCYCNPGFVKNEDTGECIAQNDCPKGPESACDENEVYITCAPSKYCQDTCLHYGSTCYDPDCREHCICKPTHVRDPDSRKCILRENCPVVEPLKCGSNEIEDQCASPIEATCGHPASPNSYYRKCQRRCVCKPSYIRKNQGGPCIPREECPKYDLCNDHEEFNHCATLCERTCLNYMYQIKCIAGCIAMCACVDGYVRDVTTGKCVRPKQCPAKENDVPTICGPNEKYDICGTTCPLTCDNYAKKLRICPDVCVPGCFCEDGYVRNLKTNSCVPIGKCPRRPECDENEVYKISGQEYTSCEKFLKNEPDTFEKPGCYCKSGYVRESSGNCVDNSTCTKCPPEKVWKECGTACPDTCKNWIVKNRPCTEQCVIGCFCRDDLVLDPDSGKCIPKEKCPYPPECGKNEMFEWSGYVPYICEKDSSVKSKFVNVPGCYCKAGYIRDVGGECVKFKPCF